MKTSTLFGSLIGLGALGAAAYYSGALKAVGIDNGSGAVAAAAAASAASAPRPPQTVSVYVAQTRDVPVTVESAGTVVALDTVDVRPQITGTIADVFIKDGQFVKAGQPLFRLDDRADRANLEKARAQLLRNQASMADLERQLKRQQELRAQNFIAQSVVDTAQSNVEAQRAAIAADVAAVRSAEVSLSYTTINATLSGRTGTVNVNRGSLVQPAAASLVMVNINQIDPIGVSFAIPENQLAAVLRASGGGGGPRGAAAGPKGGAAGAGRGGAGGATVSIVIPGGERGRNAPLAEPLIGKVVFVDNAIDTTTGTIKLKAQLTNATQALWPGQYVTVRMTMRTLADAVVVPQAALIIRGNERSVYVVKPDGTVELRGVQTRVPSGEFIVVEGVQVGEKVVVEGKQNLRPGGHVRETPYTPGAGRRAGAGPGAAGAASGAASGAGASPGAADMAAPPARGPGASGTAARAASEALP